MSCKNDDNWEDGSHTTIGNCVHWPDLTIIRNLYNNAWDLLKREEQSYSYKWGWGSAPCSQNAPSTCDETAGKTKREETEGFASIGGFITIRLKYPLSNSYTSYTGGASFDSSSFIITGGDILYRLSYTNGGCNCSGSKYGYEFGGHRQQGEWGAYLIDPCYGCTLFELDNSCDVRKQDIFYKNNLIDVLEDHYGLGVSTACPINRHWQTLSSGSAFPNYQNVCNVDVEWRTAKGQEIIKSAMDLFPVKIKCAKEDDPYTTTIENCCGIIAKAHWTEEWDGPDIGSAYDLCPKDYVDPTLYAPGNIIRWVRRRIKWIDIHPPAVFGGYVRELIMAKQIGDMWDGLDVIDGQTLRRCKLEKCEYKNSQSPKDIWVYKDSVPLREKNSLQSREASGSCDYCEQPATGGSICSCQFDDIFHVVATEMVETAACLDEYGEKVQPRPGDGEPYFMLGNTETCSDCLGKCCYDCKCEDLTEVDCMNIQEVKDLPEPPKNGPIWIGPYGFDDSCKDCKNRGEPKPCGGWKTGDPEDDYDEGKVKLCGITSACCGMTKGPLDDKGVPDPDWKCSCQPSPSCSCCCEQLTECECTERGGTWKTPTAKQIKSGQGVLCSDLCKATNPPNPDCSETCCKGTWKWREGGVVYLSGTYCNGCYEGLPKWWYPPCYDYEGNMKLERVVCGGTPTSSMALTTKCGRPKADFSSFACPDAEDGGEEPNCGDCGKED